MSILLISLTLFPSGHTWVVPPMEFCKVVRGILPSIPGASCSVEELCRNSSCGPYLSTDELESTPVEL